VTSAKAGLLAALRPYIVRCRLLRTAVGLLQGTALAGLLAAAIIAAAGPQALRSPGVAGGLAALALLPALARLARPPDPRDAALAIERAFPFLQDLVATAIDLTVRHPGRVRRSERIEVQIAREATAALRDLPLQRALPTSTVRLPALVAGLGLGMAALAWAAVPERVPASPAIRPPAVAPEAPHIPTPHPPRLFDISLAIEPPGYSGRPPRTVTEGLESVSAPAGSRITIAARCDGTSAVATARLEPGGARRMARADGDRLSHSFTLSRTIRWRLGARDAAGGSETPWHALKLIPDAPPSVRLVRPEGDLSLAAAEPVEVAARASDDFGITALGLRYRLAGEEAWHSLPLDASRGAVASASARLNPAGVGLRPGGELILRAWATDNDAVSGPKTSVSAPVRIRLQAAEDEQPQPQSPVEQAHQEEADALEHLRRAAEDLERELTEALERAAGAGGEGRETPARPGLELPEAARRLRDQAGRLEQAMRQAEQELQATELLTPDLVEKVRELHELMRQVLDEEMRRALEELQRALESQDVEQLRMSLEEAREAQQRFMQRLDQTLSLLKRARLEMALARLRRQAEDLLRRQEELTERTAELPAGRTSEARGAEREQRVLARDTQPLAAEVERAAEQAREVSGEPAARLGALSDRLMREDPAGQMRQAASALQRGSPSSAAEPQGSAERSLRSAASSLRELEEALAKDFTADARRALAHLLRDALSLSRSQEELDGDVLELGDERAADLFRDKSYTEPLRRRQNTLAEATRGLSERLLELAEQTPVVDPMLPPLARQIAEQMAQSSREIEGADLALAAGRGRQTVMALNEVARRLLELDDRLAKASAQMTLSEYMKQLQTLAQRQQGLNRRTGQAQAGRRQGQTPGMSLSQMAYEQALIRKALEEMLRRGGEATKPVADQLGGVPGEMEKVEDELRSGRIERETVERQERILEKMLEAQRSLYTREQERSERKAERPQAWEPPPSPPPLSPSLLRAPTVSVEPGAGTERLPRGYEDLVREYFRVLGEGERP